MTVYRGLILELKIRQKVFIGPKCRSRNALLPVCWPFCVFRKKNYVFEVVKILNEYLVYTLFVTFYQYNRKLRLYFVNFPNGGRSEFLM